MVYPTRRASSVVQNRVAKRVQPLCDSPALRPFAWMASGALALLAALGLFLLDPLDHVLTWQTSIAPGTFAQRFWSEPLDVLFINTYIFNITNPQQFLSGEEKLAVQEIGPFAYREVTKFAHMTVKGERASFVAQRRLELVAERSVGLPHQFNLTALNMPLLGAAAILGESSLVTNLALRSVALFVGSKPLIPLTAEELLWGYDNPLISMAHSLAPSFVDFKRLGLLDRMYSSDDAVEVVAGRNGGLDPRAETAAGVYSIASFNGEEGFAHWGHGTQPRADPDTGAPLPAELPCDTVRGAYEGVLFARKVQPWQRLYVYRKQFCRSVPLEYQREDVTDDGLRFFVYHVYLPGLINPKDHDSLCYCASSAGISGACIPSGFSTIAPCYYQMPMALSQPHMMDADPEVVNQIEGMKPEYEIHHSFFKLQPEMGVPLAIRCRLQVNLVVKRTRISLTQPFNNMVIPLMWVDMGMDLPERYMSLLRLALRVGPAAQLTGIVALALAGLALGARGFVLYRRLGRRPRMRLPRPRLPSGPAVAPDEHQLIINSVE